MATLMRPFASKFPIPHLDLTQLNQPFLFKSRALVRGRAEGDLVPLEFGRSKMIIKREINNI